MYASLFFGLPMIGIGSFLLVRRRMLEAKIQTPSVIAVFLVFMAYGALLMIAVAAAFDEWSGMHSLGFAALLFAGIPMLLWQGIRLLRPQGDAPDAATRLRRIVAALSVAFPLVFAAVIIVAGQLTR